MFIRNINLFLIFIVLSNLCLSQTKQGTIIYWSKDNKLKTCDFRGLVPDSVNGNNVAISMVQIKPEAFIDNKLPNYKIVTIFYKSGSWMKDSSKSVLIHEQLHFDIAEYFARKMRKRIAELRNSKERNANVYNNVFIELWKECDKKSDEYDKQTIHGINSIKQKEWNKQIAKELDKLKKFKVVPVS
jgi:hypothetical protein